MALARIFTRGCVVRKRVPKRAVKLVAYHEGYLRRPSDKLDGYATVGRGHMYRMGPVRPGDSNMIWVKGQKVPGQLTEAEADRLLRQDLEQFADAVAAYVKVPLNWRQASALISFVYNVGPGAFAESTLLRRLNAGDYAAVPYELSRWNKGPSGVLPGLVRRRAREGRMFRPLARPRLWIWNR